MAVKKERQYGFLQGMNFMSRINEVSFLAMVQKVIESGEYKKDYDSVKEFVKEELGITYQTYLNRTEAMRVIGPEITSILVSSGLHLRDVKMIEHMMTDEQKANLKKGVLEIGDRKIPINEAHSEDIRIAVANLIESADLSRKAEKQANKDLARLKNEFDKGDSPAKKRLAELEAIAGVPDTPEKVIAGFERIDQAFSDLETTIRVFVWKDAKKLIADDPALQAKVEGLQRQMQARVEQLIKDWDGEING
ncbi:MAG: hypothetical protein AABZ15_11625 [Nitrospirota bacterium]